MEQYTKESRFGKPVVMVCLAVLCNVLWGSAFPFVKTGYTAFHISTIGDKLLFAGIRFFIAGIMVLAFQALISHSIPKIHKENYSTVLSLAIVQTTLQYIFFYLGLANTTAANGSILNATGSFFSVILAHFIYKNDKLNTKKWIGCILGFLGVLFVTVTKEGISFNLWGDGLIVLAAFTFSIGSVISKKAAQYDSPMNVTGYNLLIGGFFLMAGSLPANETLSFITWHGILILLYLAFLSAAAFTIYTILLKYNPLGKLSIFQFIIPVSGTILSGIILHEPILQIRYLVSLLLVTAGISFVNLKFTKNN